MLPPDGGDHDAAEPLLFEGPHRFGRNQDTLPDLVRCFLQTGDQVVVSPLPVALEGMSERLAYRLAENDVRSQEDLAELSVDELLEVDEMPEEEAAALIMAARAPWFEEDSQEA